MGSRIIVAGDGTPVVVDDVTGVITDDARKVLTAMLNTKELSQFIHKPEETIEEGFRVVKAVPKTADQGLKRIPADAFCLTREKKV